MFELSTEANAAEYLHNYGQTVLLSGKPVKISSVEREYRTGSRAHGYQFSHNKYGLLIADGRYSADHGSTWHNTKAAAVGVRRGKIKLVHQSGREVLFDKVRDTTPHMNPFSLWTALNH